MGMDYLGRASDVFLQMGAKRYAVQAENEMQGGDAAILIAKHSTKSTDMLADLVDIYLKLDEIDGALVIYALKPPSRIYHVEYDYSRGYPNVQLTPVA
jgi:hypothetical protein